MEAEGKMFFNLSEPLEFSRGGEFETTYSLEILPPSARHYKATMRLTQKLTKAVLEFEGTRSRMMANGSPVEIAEAPTEGADGRPSSDLIKLVVLNSSVDVDEYVDSMRKILEDTCTFDGSTRMTAAVFEKIGIADKNRLLFEYLSNFIMALLA